MAPSFCIDLSSGEQSLLLAIARDSIHHALHEDGERALPGLTPALRTERAVFVTLTRRARLRGCIGTLEPGGPLARAVADSACSAAFRDPRFPQLQAEELAETAIEISVLTPMQPLAANSREALLAQLRSGVDGVLLQEGRHRSTFLPKVWEQLPEPHLFMDQLLAKAGLPASHWSASLRVHRYQTTTFDDSGARPA